MARILQVVRPSPRLAVAHMPLAVKTSGTFRAIARKGGRQNPKFRTSARTPTSLRRHASLPVRRRRGRSALIFPFQKLRQENERIAPATTINRPIMSKTRWFSIVVTEI